MSAKSEPTSNLAVLFRSLNINRVIQVDDVFSKTASLEDVIAFLQIGDHDGSLPEPFANIDFGNPDAVWEREVRDVWESMEDSEQQEIYAEITRSQQENPEDLTEQGRDTQAQAILRPLLDESEIEAIFYDPSEWESNKNRIFQEASEKRTLILFDLDTEGNSGRSTKGIEYIREASESDNADQLELALLSHWFTTDEEIEKAKELSDSNSLSGTEFVPISKERLREGANQFASGIKLVLLNRHRETLITCAVEAIREGNSKAVDELNNVNVFTFEHLISGSSIEEGVWEPDTLFRIFNTLSRIKARENARLDPKVHEVTESMRKLWNVSISPSAKNSSSAWKYIRNEMYEEGKYLNEHHAGIDLGDVFQSGNKYYILVSQSCDLILRKDGRRAPLGYEAIFIEVQLKEPEIRDNNFDHYFKLKCFLPNEDASGWVALRKSFSVRLDVLDLCVNTKDGNAKINLTSDSPPFMLDGQKKRYDKLKSSYEKAVKKYRDINRVISSLSQEVRDTKEVIKRMRNECVPSASVAKTFNPQVDIGNQTISYELKRLWRLRQPWAGELLSNFASFRARAAFDHDFTRTLPPPRQNEPE